MIYFNNYSLLFCIVTKCSKICQQDSTLSIKILFNKIKKILLHL